MAELTLKNLSSAQLFQLCAEDFDDNTYWEEFVNRYNPLLIRGVYHGYRRFGRQSPPRPEVMADILQDIYIELLRDRCSSLQRFRGQTELEAQAYLVHFAANITSNHLRHATAQKRRANTEHFDELFQSEEELNISGFSDYTDSLADRELIKLLRRKFTGETARRDILLYLLYVREGMTITELAAMGICDLKQSRIAEIIRQIRAELKNIY